MVHALLVYNLDLFPSYVRDLMQIGLDTEVYTDKIPEGRKAIGTHNGMFHSDESLSVSLLRLIPEYRHYGTYAFSNLLTSCRSYSRSGTSQAM